LAWSPSGQLLAAGSLNGSILIWDWEEDKSWLLDTDAGSVYGVAWSASEFLASAHEDGVARVWDVKQRTHEELNGHDGAVSCVAWSPGARELLTGSKDCSIMIWNLGRKGWVPSTTPLSGHQRQITNLCWSPSGLRFASSSADQTVLVWNRLRCGAIRTFDEHLVGVDAVAWSPTDEAVASVDDAGQAYVWSPVDLSLRGELEGHAECVSCVDFSYDGRYLATKSNDNTVRIWSSEPPLDELTCVEEKADAGWGSLAFHPTKLMIATLGANDTVIRIWRLDPEPPGDIRGRAD
jgi:WD40 repeat protein